MTCTSPYTAYKVFDGDKFVYKVGSGQNSDGSFSDKFIFVPCGQCMSCRLSRAKEWSHRCMMELQYHEDAVFLTLTYDDEYLPKNSSIIYDEETGEFKAEVHSLVKKDLTDFLKRLRYYYDQPIRYLACGEYGSKSFRPHFHLIIFGLKLTDLKILRQNYRGELYYTSDFISKIWKYGFHTIGSVTPESCGYVARYTTKKLLGNSAKFYEKNNIVPPYLVMSRQPGIGYQFLQDHKDEIYKYDRITISTPNGSETFGVPKYFRKRMEIEDGDRYVDYLVRREERLFATHAMFEYDLFVDSEFDEAVDKLKTSAIIESKLNNRLGHLKERSAI